MTFGNPVADYHRDVLYDCISHAYRVIYDLIDMHMRDCRCGLCDLLSGLRLDIHTAAIKMNDGGHIPARIYILSAIGRLDAPGTCASMCGNNTMLALVRERLKEAIKSSDVLKSYPEERV